MVLDFWRAHLFVQCMLRGQPSCVGASQGVCCSRAVPRLLGWAAEMVPCLMGCNLGATDIAHQLTQYSQFLSTVFMYRLAPAPARALARGWVLVVV